MSAGSRCGQRGSDHPLVIMILERGRHFPVNEQGLRYEMSPRPALERKNSGSSLRGAISGGWQEEVLDGRGTESYRELRVRLHRVLL